MKAVGYTLKVRYVVIDVITGNEVCDPVRFESEAAEMIPGFEESDKECGCYQPNMYKVERIEVL